MYSRLLLAALAVVVLAVFAHVVEPGLARSAIAHLAVLHRPGLGTGGALGSASSATGSFVP